KKKKKKKLRAYENFLILAVLRGLGI
ncbi:hypothetical protein, partial [Plasmodium yoelii yoelii]